MPVLPIPEGFHSVSCYLVVANAEEAIAFYEKAFGAELVSRINAPGSDLIIHAEIRIGNSMVMLAQASADWGTKSAKELGGSPVSMHIYVEDVDASYARAVNSGCDIESPLMNAFWGDRYGKVRDPFGLSWGLATHIEDVAAEEMDDRAAAWFASMGETCT